jgi:hypothetical protein
MNTTRDKVDPWTLLTLFWRCWIRISARTANILIEYFVIFLSPPGECWDSILIQDSRFLSYPFQFTTH